MSAEAGQSAHGAGWGMLAVTRYPDQQTMHVQQWRLPLPHADEFGWVFHQTLGEPAEEQAVAVIRTGNIFGFRAHVGSAEHGHASCTDNIALAWVLPSCARKKGRPRTGAARTTQSVICPQATGRNMR